jgi:hypothetical protein
MGRFRSLFDADEMRDLAVAAGLVDEAAATPEAAERPVRRSLLLDDDAGDASEPSVNSLSPQGLTVSIAAAGTAGPASVGHVGPSEPPVAQSERHDVAASHSTSVADMTGAAVVASGAFPTAASYSEVDAAADGSSPDPYAASSASSTELAASSSPVESAGEADDNEARVRLLLMQYLAVEQPTDHVEQGAPAVATDTPLPAVVVEEDESSVQEPLQERWNEASGPGLDTSTRQFLSTPSAALLAAPGEMGPPGDSVSALPFSDSTYSEPVEPWQASSAGIAAAGAQGPPVAAPLEASGVDVLAFDTPFEASHSRTVVSTVTEPAPLPGQPMLVSIASPPLLSLLRASLLARVPLQAWHEEPWAQPDLCAALANVTGESEEFFAQEDAWRT